MLIIGDSNTSQGFGRSAVNPGWSVMFDKPVSNPEMEPEYEVMPRHEFGVLAFIPPEVCRQQEISFPSD